MRDKYIFEPSIVPAIAGSHLERMRNLVADYFSGEKTKRKASANLAAEALQKAMTAKSGQSSFSYVKDHQIIFEKAHLKIGTATIGQLSADLRLTVLKAYRDTYWNWTFSWNNPLPHPDSVGDLTCVAIGANSWSIQVQARETPGVAVPPVVIGSIYRGNGRFELLSSQPPDAVNTVYVKRTQPHQHYVCYLRDGAEHFIRRYVVRGLNQNDSVQIAAKSALQAAATGSTAKAMEIRQEDAIGRHNVAEDTELNMDQQILSHTRGWNKRFISATTTSRTVYSTRGEEFTSVFGKVIIDLAFVPGQDIYDLHTPDALHHFGTTGEALLNPPTSAHLNPALRALAEEKHLAARDVIRTREVLIRESVPLVAIRFKDLGKRVVAISHTGDDENGSKTFTAVEGAWKLAGLGPWQGEETLTYRRDHRWYKFYLFASAIEATRRIDAVPKEHSKAKSTRSFFDIPDKAPEGFAR